MIFDHLIIHRSGKILKDGHVRMSLQIRLTDLAYKDYLDGNFHHHLIPKKVKPTPSWEVYPHLNADCDKYFAERGRPTSW